MGQGRKRWGRTLGAGMAALCGLGFGLVPAAGPAAATTVSATTGQLAENFWMATPSGTVLNFGTTDYGSPAGPLNKPIVGITPTSNRAGYWLVASDGGVFTYGNARYYGSTGNLTLNKPIVGMAPTPDGKGYWMVASDGGIFSFGDAHFYGSTGNLTLNKPIVGMAPTPDGKGYWMVASDGGIFSFGDAHFYGSTGNLKLDQPVTGMTATADGSGYWMVAADGGVFTFGDAHFYGSAASHAGEPARQLVPNGSGSGYWIVQQNGTAYAFGSATAANAPPFAVLLSATTPGDKADLFAFQQLGKPYIWGGNGPVGYDCSGLALASWSHGSGVTFARVADDQYHTAGSPVALTSLQAGDLVFWGDNRSDWSSVYHTALYVGGNRIVEATGNHVQLNTLGQWGMADVMPNGRRP